LALYAEISSVADAFFTGLSGKKDFWLMRNDLKLCLAWVALTVACGGGPVPAIERLSPLNGETAVATTFKPEVMAAAGSKFELPEEARRVVLYDVTNGGKKAVAAQILVEGRRITYEPNDALPADHDFELVILRDAIFGDEIQDLDGSEWPEEAIAWPFKLAFSTRIGPLVRSAYLQRPDSSPYLIVRFSQPMNMAITSSAFALTDQQGIAIPFGQPVWRDVFTAELHLQDTLDATAIYALAVSTAARAVDGSSMSQNFAISFTGSQRLILSRIPGS
jgi:hypothetical protein